MRRRYILIAMALAVIALLLWWLAPALATSDERQLLNIVAASERRDGRCLPLLTDRHVFGGTYGFPLEKDRWLDPIYDRTEPRKVRLIAGSGDGVTFAGIFLDARDAICAEQATIQTPAVRGNIAFVNVRRAPVRSYGRDGPAFNGSYAFHRSGLGWRIIASKEKDDRPVR